MAARKLALFFGVSNGSRPDEVDIPSDFTVRKIDERVSPLRFMFRVARALIVERPEAVMVVLASPSPSIGVYAAPAVELFVLELMTRAIVPGAARLVASPGIGPFNTLSFLDNELVILKKSHFVASTIIILLTGVAVLAIAYLAAQSFVALVAALGFVSFLIAAELLCRRLVISREKRLKYLSFCCPRTVRFDSGIFLSDKDLGYRLIPKLDLRADIDLAPMGMKRSFQYSTDDLGRRQTLSPGKHADPGEVWVLGCSYTFGLSLNDSDTFCSQLAEKIPYPVRNLGVPGYSIYQMLILFEEMLKRQPAPKLVILGYHQDLDYRNVFSPRHAVWFRGPSCVSKADPRQYSTRLKRFHHNYYYALPYSSNSVLVESLSNLLNDFRFRKRDRHIDSTTQALMLRLTLLCEQAGSNFLVAALDQSHHHDHFFEKFGISNCCAGIDFSERGEDGRSLWTLSPFDETHPNETANRRIAEILSEKVPLTLGRPRSTTALLKHHRVEQRPRQAMNEAFYPHF